MNGLKDTVSMIERVERLEDEAGFHELYRVNQDRINLALLRRIQTLEAMLSEAEICQEAGHE